MKQPTLTEPTQKVLKALIATKRPLSAYDILEKSGIKSPPTVYRALEKLAATGLIHRLESLNAYIACCQHDTHDCGHSHGHAPDHVSQFAICTSCGDVEELESKTVAKLVREASDGFLAQIDKRVFELAGICHACAGK